MIRERLAAEPARRRALVLLAALATWNFAAAVRIPDRSAAYAQLVEDEREEEDQAAEPGRGDQRLRAEPYELEPWGGAPDQPERGRGRPRVGAGDGENSDEGGGDEGEGPPGGLYQEPDEPPPSGECLPTSARCGRGSPPCCMGACVDGVCEF